MGEELKNLKMLKQGAEAKLFICNYLGRPTLIKERFQKKYRHPNLDTAITKERIKIEARSIVRCKVANIRTPALYLVDFERRRIYMEYYEKSITVKDFIIKHVKDAKDKKLELIAKFIGETVRKLHCNDIIHGDLTTSNMLLIPRTRTDDPQWLETSQLDLVMIDFGLSFIHSSAEDKAVDLYVLERALISTHNDYPDLFSTILEAYESFVGKGNIKEILRKLEEVRARGRKRTMIG